MRLAKTITAVVDASVVDDPPLMKVLLLIDVASTILSLNTSMVVQTISLENFTYSSSPGGSREARAIFFWLIQGFSCCSTEEWSRLV